MWENSRELYYKYSENARKNALKYDWSIIVDKLEKIIKLLNDDRLRAKNGEGS
jgi:hypothetical protein